MIPYFSENAVMEKGWDPRSPEARRMVEEFANRFGVSNAPSFGDIEIDLLYPDVIARGHTFWKASAKSNTLRHWILDGNLYGLTKKQAIARLHEIIDTEEPIKK